MVKDDPTFLPLWRRTGAFTIAELLTVIAIITVLMMFAVGAIGGFGRARTLQKAGSEIAGLLEMARAHAMAYNTYVWVGLQAGPDDLLVVATVASRDGVATPASEETGGAGSDLRQLGALKRFPNLQLVALPDSSPHRAAGDGVSVFTGTTPAALSFKAGSGAGVVEFDACVIRFNPAGEASIEPGKVERRIELGLQTSINATVVDPHNYIAIQIGGLSGAISVLQP